MSSSSSCTTPSPDQAIQWFRVGSEVRQCRISISEVWWRKLVLYDRYLSLTTLYLSWLPAWQARLSQPWAPEDLSHVNDPPGWIRTIPAQGLHLHLAATLQQLPLHWFPLALYQQQERVMPRPVLALSPSVLFLIGSKITNSFMDTIVLHHYLSGSVLIVCSGSTTRPGTFGLIC